jgi:hypothetical protein
LRSKLTRYLTIKEFNKTENLLPQILPGTVHAQFRRCGKSNCKCTTRDELHHSYYHFVRIGGKLHKRYLKPDEVERIKVGCAVRQREEKQRRDQTKENWQIFRESRAAFREVRDALNQLFKEMS